MGRLINTTTITVDGVTDVGKWYVADGGHDRASLDQFIGAAGMVLGRPTYEGLAGFWPHQTGAWADTLNPLPKFVASRAAQGPLAWNATSIEGDVAEGVAQLKADLDGDLVMSGCGELARTLLALGLVDELRFWVHPVVWGGGARPNLGEGLRMTLIEVTPFDSGVVLQRYQPAGV